MDPIIFSMNWPQLGEALTTIVVLSFVVEQSLALLLENKHVAAIVENRGFKNIPELMRSISIGCQSGVDVIACRFRALIKFFHDIVALKSARANQQIKL